MKTNEDTKTGILSMIMAGFLAIIESFEIMVGFIIISSFFFYKGLKKRKSQRTERVFSSVGRL